LLQVLAENTILITDSSTEGRIIYANEAHRERAGMLKRHRLSQQETIMRFMNIATLALVIVGAVNWGLMGFFQFDLVATLFGGPQAAISRIVYGLVGLAGLYQLFPLIAALSGQPKTRNSRRALVTKAIRGAPIRGAPCPPLGATDATLLLQQVWHRLPCRPGGG
jgi:uncharacterized protein